MSDRIFALLLRVYPSSFREKYREEALQLYRDRLHDESGPLRRTRLYCDLLFDAAIGLPRSWRNSYAPAAGPSLAPCREGAPKFRLLENEPLRPGAVFFGGTLSFVALVAFGAVLSLPSAFLVTSGRAKSAIESVLDRVNRAASEENSDQASAGASLPDASSVATSSQNRFAISPASGPNLTDAERNRVIQSVAENMVAHYYDRARAQQASLDLISLQKDGYYSTIVDGRTLATRLTFELQRITDDRHLRIEFSINTLPKNPQGPSSAALDQYRAAMHQENCTFENVEILSDHIGYIKLNSFPDPAVCGAIAQTAMARVSRSEALIFDLRDNTGGFPEMVAAMAAPLFDRPVRWYNPRQGDGSTWLSPGPGSRLADKPVYILTSPRTLSAAEQFTYNLKMLKRATIIGDTTGGGAHVGVFHRIDDHFGMGIPETRIDDPYGQPDWDVTGIEPDVKVVPQDALATARELAQVRLRK